jgi:hypothetical protein
VPLSAISLIKKKNKSWLAINTTKDAVKSASGYSYDKKDGVWNPKWRKQSGVGERFAQAGVATRSSIASLTKHIVASGISKVVFLEPYPKSLALDLHTDSIQVESGERGNYQNYPCVSFEHFYGISPRRYRELFERGRRKDKNGKLQNYIDGQKRPNIDYTNPFYNQMEEQTVKDNTDIITKAIAEIDQREESI